MTVRCILEHAPDVNIEYSIRASHSQVGDAFSSMDQPSNEFEPAANRVELEIGDSDIKAETSHSRIPSNDSGIEFDLQVRSRNLE